MNRYSISFLLLTLAAPLQTAQAGELGRLFYTPQQRQQLEVQGNSAVNEQGEVKRNYIVVDGVVQRHGGNRTVWVNGNPQAAGQGGHSAPTSVPVAVPGKSSPVQLKVGEKLMLDTPAASETHPDPSD